MPTNYPAENTYPPDELAQLPHGRHGLPPEFVAHNQRERLIASFTALVGEVGFSGATITAVTEGASVSSRTFYKFFETVEDCCIAAYEKGVADLMPVVAEAYGSEREWPLKVRAVIEALLSEVAEYPELGRLLTVEPFVAGPEIAKRHKAALEGLVPYLRAGRRLSGSFDQLPETAEKALLGAAASTVGRHILAQGGDGLGELVPDLTQFVLTPYLGAAEARRFATA